MKNKKTINRTGFAALAIGFLTSSSLVMSATYDPLKLQQNNFNAIDQIAPSNNESGSSSSMLDSLQQAEINNKKANFLEALNL
ncbi:MAG: hypothetical protein Q7T91_00870, partial [Sulfuricurvum sp.]|nr:hypothetical protein [Sulfuricurvum sp.]